MMEPTSEDFYNVEAINEFMENDQITPSEEGFMLGYLST